MPNKLVMVLSVAFLAVTSAYAASPEQPNSVPLDQNSLQTLIDNANKGDANAQFDLGRCYYKGEGVPQDCNEAVKWWKKAADQGYTEAHYNLGAAYGKLGRWQDEIESYKQAIRIKPDYAEAYNNLGVAYHSLGRYQDAVEACKQAIRIKPGYAEAHYNLGNAYLLSGDKGSALEEYKILKTLDAELANKLFNLIYK